VVPILEVPAVRQRVAPISVATYHRLAEEGLVDPRTELLRGVIIEKMSKSPLHVAIVRRLFEALSVIVSSGRFVRKEDPLTLVDSEPEPDLAVVQGQPDDFRTAHPQTALVVVEVAVSAEETDRAKSSIFAEAGVGEYWLVLPEAGVVEVFFKPEGGAYAGVRIVGHGEVLTSETLPALQLALSDLFA
jgi:Uma2 family endonuclease